ncbi:MAG: HAD-IA family hydrolase [Patescibacteria group bacterium]|jgi:phosphoglycolate phosphatase
MPKKIIFFDFDGVIVNTFFDAYNIMRQTNPNLTEDEYRQIFNTGVYRSIQQDGIVPVDNFFDQYDAKIVHDPVKDGIAPLLPDLAKDFTLVIISSTYTASIKRYLDENNLSEYFTQVLGGDVDHSKTNKIRRVLADTGIDAVQSILITDTSGDVIEAESAGVKSIAVSWGYQDKQTLQKSHAVVVVDDVDQLEREIRDNFKL